MAMPYCSHCGNQVRDTDAYCTRCGAKQPVKIPRAFTGATDGVSDRTSVILCYIPIVGWIAAIIVLAAARFRQKPVIRFHAFQGLYLFVAWLLADRVISPLLHVSMLGSFHDAPGWALKLAFKLAELVIIAAGAYMMTKANENEKLALPIVGELAEKSL